MTEEQYKVLQGVRLKYQRYKVTTFNDSGKFFIMVIDQNGPLLGASVTDSGKIRNKWRRQDDEE